MQLAQNQEYTVNGKTEFVFLSWNWGGDKAIYYNLGSEMNNSILPGSFSDKIQLTLGSNGNNLTFKNLFSNTVTYYAYIIKRP